MTDPKNFDQFIDLTARQMTDADPSAELSSRVLARLDDRRPRWWLWTGGLLAAATAAIALVMMLRPSASAPAMQQVGAHRLPHLRGERHGRHSATYGKAPLLFEKTRAAASIATPRRRKGWPITR